MGMSLGLDKITVDTAALANGASIAAYLTSAAGTLITSSAVGGKNAIDSKDVADYVINSTATTVGDNGQLGLAQRHDANTTLAAADGNYAPLQLDANGALKISGTLTAVFTAEHNEDDPFVNGDSGIATLLVRQDTLAVSTSADGDYGSFKSTNLGELYVHDTSVLAQLVTANTALSAIQTSSATTATNTTSIATSSSTTATNTTAIATSTATTATNTGTTATNTGSINTNILALSKAEDAVHASGDLGIQALAVRKDAQGSNVSADGDYTSLITWSEGSLKVVDVSNSGILQQQITVGATATAIPAVALANRKSILIQNAGNASVWIGSATVTASGATTGVEVPKGGFIELDAGPAVTISAIRGASAINVNVLESA